MKTESIWTDQQERLRSAMEQLLLAMCEKPGTANLRLLPSDHSPVLVFTCDRVDYGAINGKKGTMLEKLQLLTECLAKRLGFADCKFILDDEKCMGQRGQRTYVEPAPNWSPDYLEQVATLFCTDLFGAVQVTTERVTDRSSRVTVTVTDPEEEHSAFEAKREELEQELNVTLEQALEQVFNCIGALSGKKIYCQLVE